MTAKQYGSDITVVKVSARFELKFSAAGQNSLALSCLSGSTKHPLSSSYLSFGMCTMHSAVRIIRRFAASNSICGVTLVELQLSRKKLIWAPDVQERNRPWPQLLKGE
jgi:hypothetical protein